MTSAEAIDIQLSGDDMTADEFINQGKKRVYAFKWTDRTISVSTHVEKTVREDGFVLYKLIIKGNYLRASSVKITLSHPALENTVDSMWQRVGVMVADYLPQFIFEDYPDSLKKVAADNAAN